MPQQKEIKYFGNPANGGGDFDSADFSVGENSWVNAENVRSGSTDAGVINTIESVGSNVLRTPFQPSVTFIPLGAEPDTENNRFVYFLYDIYSSLHRIMCYYADTQTTYTVLLSTQVTGGLNFHKDFPIHSARIVNNMLYWVEGTNNQPRKINIESGIKLNHPSFATDEPAYTAPLNFSEITIIKPTASLAPNIQKGLDNTFINNFIANDSFEFAHQFEYYDNEVSVVGTYSPASRLNLPTDTYNYISVVMDALQEIPSTVRIVNLVVRLGNTNNAKIVKTWDREVPAEAQEIEDHNNNITLLTFNFYNNITGPPIAEDYVLKSNDEVPIYSNALEIAKNRLFLANNIKGYDTPGETSLEASVVISGISGVTSVTKQLTEVRASVNKPGSSNDFAYGGWYVLLTSTDINVPGYYLLNGTEKSSTNALDIIFWRERPALDAPPTTTSIAGLTFIGATQAEVVDYILYTFGADPGNTLNGSAFYVRSNLLTVTGITTTTTGVFKSRSGLKLGTVFYDFAMRKCGVVTSDSLLINIPSRNYAYSTATREIIWTLSNANAVDEIPDWAYYYSVVRTLNLKTRYFIDSFTNAAKYVTKDASGNYVFTNDTFVNGAVGIGLDTTALIQSGLGYSFTQGDIAVLTTDANNTYELPVVDQYGNYIIVKAQDIGDLSTIKIIYEVYIPYQTSDQEPFFEVGQMYVVNNPTTALREYSITTDVMVPDAYTIQRSYATETYVAEAMSPNDLFFQTWYNDGGKPNFVTKLGQVNKKNFISYSNTFIPGTAVNGLSTFEALNETSVAEDCGAVQKLIITSKVQNDQGIVMLAICTVETNSLYLGETQIIDTTGGTQFFASAQGVIGTINTLKGSFGTINPESVCQYRGNVYWFDAANGRYIQYSVNGLFPISNYKATRFWKMWSLQYMSMTAEQIEALGNRPFVFSTVDPRHNELLITIPKLSNTPPKGYLPDPTPQEPILKSCMDMTMTGLSNVDGLRHNYYGIFVYISETNPQGYYLITSTQQTNTGNTPPTPTTPPSTITFADLTFMGSNLQEVAASIKTIILLQQDKVFDLIVSSNGSTTLTGLYSNTVYPFDILDYQAKTMVYCLTPEPNHWQGSYSFVAEAYVVLQNKLFTLKNGSVYEHNQTNSYCEFYGVQYKPKIMFISNSLPDLPKSYNNISVQANVVPTLTYAYNDSPYEQCTDLVDFDYRELEGIFYATFYRNKLQPTFSGYNTDGLLTAEKMRAVALKVLLEFTITTTPLELKFVSLGYTVSKGHRTEK